MYRAQPKGSKGGSRSVSAAAQPIPSDRRNRLALFPPPILPIVRPLAFPVFGIGCKTLPIAISDHEKLLLSKSRIVRVACSLVLPLLLAAPLTVFGIVGVPFSFEPSLAFQRWAGRG